ncbi:hypothetical protein [Duganella sp.]|uniref:hypothetical protein n=1 Tax=Duganella sp. TaxID=1904440 RepID=UPI0031DBDC6D
MMGLFSRRRKPAADTGGLGTSLIALRLDAGDIAPAQSMVVIFNAAGHARRAAAGKVSCEQGEVVFCFHPGPYTADLIPFAAAPEWGLRLRFVVDAANPRVSQQRFDLYLYSETAGRLTLADFASSAELALQAELAQGALDLPPCTTLEEWHAFRAGLNQLMYTRYGVTVDDCVPVDLGEQIDYAAILQTRAATAPTERTSLPPARPAVPTAHTSAPATPTAASTAPVAASTAPATQSGVPPVPPAAPTAPAAVPAAPSFASVLQAHGAMPSAASAPAAGAFAASSAGPVAEQDARSLRRLFLELPALSTALRILTLPEDLTIFQQHQALLMRLGMAALNVNTMPALAWAAPDLPLPADDQARRSAQTLIAQTALDEAWSLLARLQRADPQQWPQLLDEADRICANLETGLSLRRTPHIARMEPSL